MKDCHYSKSDEIDQPGAILPPGVPPSTREAEIPFGLVVLEKRIAVLSEVTAKLSARLSLVCRSSVPTPAADKTTRPPPQTPLGSALNEAQLKLNDAILQISSVIARLEL